MGGDNFRLAENESEHIMNGTSDVADVGKPEQIAAKMGGCPESVLGGGAGVSFNME